jgi:hypothetical protein
MVVAPIHHLQPIKTDTIYECNLYNLLHPTFCQLATPPVNLTDFQHIISWPIRPLLLPLSTLPVQPPAVDSAPYTRKITLAIDYNPLPGFSSPIVDLILHPTANLQNGGRSQFNSQRASYTTTCHQKDATTND